MRFTRALVIVMDKELDVPVKVQNLRRLEQDVRTFLNLPLEKWRASTEEDPDVPVSNRAKYNTLAGRQESVLDVGTRGAIGCATSHVRALRSIAAAHAQQGTEDPHAWSAIFESDAHFGRMPAKLRQFLQDEGPRASTHTPDPPSLIILHTFVQHGVNSKAVPDFSLLRKFTDTFMSTSTVLVRNRDAGRIAAALVPIEVQVDGGYGMAATLGLTPPVWGAVPSITGIAIGDKSSIQTRMPLKPLLPYNNSELGPILVLPWFLFLGTLIALIVLAVKGHQDVRSLGGR